MPEQTIYISQKTRQDIKRERREFCLLLFALACGSLIAVLTIWAILVVLFAL